MTVDFNEALRILYANAPIYGTEQVSLAQSHTRILAEDVFYDVNIPPFNKSAMDGYACRLEDINNELTVIETIYAGHKPQYTVGVNQCSKIMTGAVVPDGADSVIMKEHVEVTGDNRITCPSGKTKTNICYTSEDVTIGDLALPKSCLLTAKHIPILSGAGMHNPTVYKQPKVSVFATGSELVEPNETPLPYQIRNSNSGQMIAQLAEMGLAGTYEGIIRDNLEETSLKMSNALLTSDILILSGGVSVGDFDFIPTVVEKLGFEILLSSSAIQPGKPIIFAKKGTQFIFGLAGNPASSFIQFELYVKPFLYRTMSYKSEPFMTKATLTEDHTRPKVDRLKFIPSLLHANNTVTPVEYHGAAHINALINSNCLIMMPLGVKTLKKGEEVDVRFL